MTARLATIALLVVAALLFNLTGYPLLDPDEGRNAEVSREMAATGDYLHPRLNGLPYPDKPVLFFTAAAVFVKVFGPTELAVRIPPLVFTLATLVLVWWWGRRLFGDEAGWIAAIVAGASPLTLGFAHTVIMDSALSLFVCGAIIAFYEAIEMGRRPDGQTVDSVAVTVRPSDRPTVWSALAWISLAFGVLTKGPIALALPLMVAIPYAVWRRRMRALFDPIGVLAFVAIVLPWVRSMSDAAPGFVRYALVTETLLRLTTPALERTGPWWYFLPILVAGTAPWSLVVLGAWKDLGWLDGQTVRRSDGRDSRIVFLLLWVLVPLVFFSFSQSKLSQYVLPLVAPIALLVAGLWRRSDGQTARRSIRVASAFLVALGFVLVLGHGAIIGLIRHMPANIEAAVHAPVFWLGWICVASGALALVGRRRLDLTLLTLSLPLVSLPVVSRSLLREIGRDRSAAELARGIILELTSQTEIVGVQAFPPSLPFYVGRVITLATTDGKELTSNYIQRSVDLWRRIPGSTLRPAAWWRDALLECERPRVFVARADDSEARTPLSGKLPLIAETGRYVAYGPCGKTDLSMGRSGGWAVGRLEDSGEKLTAQPPNRRTTERR